MDEITLYDRHTGRITLSGPREYMDEAKCTGAQTGWIEGTYSDAHHYVDLTDPDQPVPVERGASPLTLTGQTLTAVPEGTVLYIDGEPYELDGPVVELDLPLPGVYELRARCFPYLDWTRELVIQ